MPGIVIRTRITPPRRPGNIIPRQHLLTQLSAYLGKTLILVCAPAGYGKTTLVQDLLDKQGINYAWLYASQDISTPYSFFNYLIQSLKQLNPGFGDATMQIMETIQQEEKRFPGQEDILKEIAGNFMNDFCTHFTDDAYIVIDDLHNLNDYAWVKPTFDKLLEYSPGNMHLIITTRVTPDFNLTKLEATRTIAHLRQNDLNFTREEVAAVLSSVYSMEYSEEDLTLLERELHGWITGIHLIIQAYGKNFNRILHGGVLPVGPQQDKGGFLPESVFNYFAEEIFSKLDSDTRQFLLNTAMLDIIVPRVCDDLLNLRNTAYIVNELMNKNIFVQELHKENQPTPEKYFSYLDLFRKFLIWKLYELKSKSEIQLLLQKYYEYYLAQGDAESAIRFCLLGENYDAAIALIKEHFASYFEQGKFETMWKWLEPLSKETLEKFPELIYLKGLLYKYYLGNLESSLDHVQRAITLLEGRETEEFLFNCYISQAEILLNLGRSEEVIRSLTRLAEMPATPNNKAKLLYFLAHSYFMMSEYAKALELSNQSLEICMEHNLKDIQLDNFTVLGNIYIDRGEYVKATYYYEKILAKSTNLFKKYLSLCNLVLVCSRSGRFEQAMEHISSAEELLRRFITPIFETAFLLANYSVRYDVGDYEQCLLLLEKINKIARKTGRRDYIWLTYQQLAETCYYLNNLSRANEYLDFSTDYIDKSNRMNFLDLNFLRSIIEKKLGELNDVEENILDAYSFYSENSFFENQTKAAFHLADYYMKLGMPQTAEKYLRESLSMGAEKEYISFFQREFLDSRKLFDFAIQRNIEKSFVKTIMHSAVERTNYDWLSIDCKQRIRQEVEKLYDITMICFGGLEFRVRGKRIPEDKWIRKKRKLVLAYLLLHSDLLLTKDKIIDLFYADTPMESADNIFHQTISTIRNVLRVDDEKPAKENPQFILYEDKVLKLNPDFTYMVDALEFKRIYNSAYSAGIALQKKKQLMGKAIDLYRGELLSGEYEQWCEDLRHDYQNMFTKITEDLIEILKSERNYNEVIYYSERLLLADKLNEGGYLNIIESYVKLNNASRGREKFSQMLKIFDAELGEKPTTRTLERIKNLLSG